MIALLRGKLHSVEDDKIVLLAGSVGYSVTCTKSALNKATEDSTDIELSIFTNMSDHSIELFGFVDALEKGLFIKLISVSGIGPKAGLSLVSAFGVRNLVSHIYSGNEKAITKAPGIGKKSAKRLIVELSSEMEKWKNRFSRPIETISLISKRSGIVEKAVSGLINMGYRASEVDTVIAELERESQAGSSLSAIVMKGLSLLRKESR
jgi:holliday junction DNA helicase RuvA